VSDAFETVHTTFDRVEAEMVAEVLVAEGIDARLIGTTNAALIGAAPHILRLRIQVPSEAAAQAREIIAGLQGAEAASPEAAAAAEAEAEAEGVAPNEGEPAPPAATPEPPHAGSAAPARRHPLLAAGAAFVLPGGCHIYARHPWSALLLVLGYVVALVVMVAARRPGVAAGAAFMLGALILADALGGQLAVRRTNLGLRATRARQVARGVVLVCVTALLGTLFGAVAPQPKPRPPFRYGPYLIDHRPPDHSDLPLDLPGIPPEMEWILRQRGAASQPASAPLLWPRPRIPVRSAPSPEIPH
jgi:hypothetical protein